MYNLSHIFYIISRLYIIPFIKLNILIFFEILYNVLYKFIKTETRYLKSTTRKKAVLTGGSKGIGKEIVKKLVDLNFEVTILSRDVKSMSKIQEECGKQNIKYCYLDLSDLKSIRPALNKLDLENVDLLINNAGVYNRKVIKKDGMESNLLINFISHYLVTERIDAHRVVNVSSSVVYSIKSIKDRGYDLFMENYAQSKLANLLHTLYLKQMDRISVAVHPGIVATGLFDNTIYGKLVWMISNFMPFIFTSVNDAAENVLHACFAKDLCKDKEKIDFYMYCEKSKVPDYVNYSNMVKLHQYAFQCVNDLTLVDE